MRLRRHYGKRRGRKNFICQGKLLSESDSTILQVSGKLHDPPGPVLSFQNQIPIAAGRNLYKAVVIIVKSCFVAIWKNYPHGLPAAQEAPFYVL